MNCYVAFAAVLVLVSAANGHERVWTDSTGNHRTSADFIDLAKDTVSLRTADGKVITVAISALSERDRTLLTAISKGRELADPSTPTGTTELFKSFVEAVSNLEELDRKFLIENIKARDTLLEKSRRSLDGPADQSALAARSIAIIFPEHRDEMVKFLTTALLEVRSRTSSRTASEARFAAALDSLVPNGSKIAIENAKKESENRIAIQRAAEKARQAAAKAAVEAEATFIANATVDLTNAIDFPEDYLNKDIYVDRAELSDKGNWTRLPEAQLYIVGLSKEGKSSNTYGLVSDKLNFVLQDQWGRSIDVSYQKELGVNVKCHVMKLKANGSWYYVARIYEIAYKQATENFRERVEKAAFGGVEGREAFKAWYKSLDRKLHDETFRPASNQQDTVPDNRSESPAFEGDLLPYISLADHVKSGIVTKTENSITLDSQSVLSIPFKASRNYELEIKFVRTVGADSLIGLLPAGDGHFNFGLSQDNGKQHTINGASHSPGHIKNGTVYTVRIVVKMEGQDAHVQMLLNGNKVVDTRFSNLAVDKEWAGIQTGWIPAIKSQNATYEIKAINLKPL